MQTYGYRELATDIQQRRHSTTRKGTQIQTDKKTDKKTDNYIYIRTDAETDQHTETDKQK